MGNNFFCEADYSEKLLNHDQRRTAFFATVQAAVTNPDELTVRISLDNDCLPWC